MNFSNLNRTILEILPKECQTTSLLNHNEKSHFVEIIKLILIQNNDLMDISLDLFITKLNLLMRDDYLVKINNVIKEKYEINVLEEFNKIFDEKKFYLLKDFFNKYPIDKNSLCYVDMIFSISSIINYIDKFIPQDEINQYKIIEFNISF
jgi:hypothetical protein